MNTPLCDYNADLSIVNGAAAIAMRDLNMPLGTARKPEGERGKVLQEIMSSVNSSLPMPRVPESTQTDFLRHQARSAYIAGPSVWMALHHVPVAPGVMQSKDVMLADVQNLEDDTEMYDEECIKPSSYAFARLRELLTQSAKYIQSTFPLGTVYPDGSGALRVEWTLKNREITLVIYPNKEDKHYIFFKEGKEYGGDYTVTPEHLSKYLEWLNKDERTAN